MCCNGDRLAICRIIEDLSLYKDMCCNKNTIAQVLVEESLSSCEDICCNVSILYYHQD